MRRRLSLIALVAAAALCVLVPGIQAAPPYTSNTSGTTANGTLDALTDLNTGATPGVIVTAASLNCSSIKASSANLYSLAGSSTANAPHFVRVYNIATTPSATANTPVMIIGVPAAAASSGNVLPNTLPPLGIALSNGLGLCITGGGTITDNTNAAVGSQINYSYK